MMIKLSLALFSIISFVVFSSCEKDNSPKPEISNFELAYDNNKTIHAGEDLHLEAEIVSLGKIDKVQIVIHKHGDHEHKSVLSGEHEHEWEVDTTYTKFSGLKNTKFHEHIEIPEDAEAGEYALHFAVIDMEGNSSDIDDGFYVEHNHE
jgi:hypothetical protein